jgi:hypothetical protein
VYRVAVAQPIQDSDAARFAFLRALRSLSAESDAGLRSKFRDSIASCDLSVAYDAREAARIERRAEQVAGLGVYRNVAILLLANARALSALEFLSTEFCADSALVATRIVSTFVATSRAH